MTTAKHKSHNALTIDAPYLALRGKLSGVYCEGWKKIDPI